MKRIISLSALCLWVLISQAQGFSLADYQGSRLPYRAPEESHSQYPDTLEVAGMQMLARHGARYATSEKSFVRLVSSLKRAEAEGLLLPDGRILLALAETSLRESEGKWGELDSIGMAEQAGIARRMAENYPGLFRADSSLWEYDVLGKASKVPRCRMSMYSFLHELSLCREDLKICSSSGPEWSEMLRPFEVDSAYLEYREREPYKGAYDAYCMKELPWSATERWVDGRFFADKNERRRMLEDAYYVVSSQSSIGQPHNPLDYMTEETYAALWRCDNLRQYLTRCGNEFSDVPALIARDFLRGVTDGLEGQARGEDPRVQLWFGHAETVMPFVSLIRMEGCWWEGKDFGELWKHWQTFHVVPMASNVQMVLFRAPSGMHYVRFMLNERPVRLSAFPEEEFIPLPRLAAYFRSLL